MFCPKCGKENSNDVKFCRNCGANISAPSVTSPAVTSATTPSEQMTFGKAISTCFAKYVDFKGRASRPEFWWFYLFTILLSWGSILVDSSQALSMIVNLAVFLPVIAAGSRRLHDTNRSGWWQLIMLTVIGIIPLVIWWAGKGSEQDSQYGSPA
ncbi:MAG: DUF805 domain-containing protein [Gallionellaceae bacterium]|nr:DUF805 domain-containing protein [Gallionellaceae bacterium]